MRSTKMYVDWAREITLPDGAQVEVEYEVEADCSPPIPPTIRMDPDDCDPGDPGEVDITKVFQVGPDWREELDLKKFLANLSEEEHQHLEEMFLDDLHDEMKERAELAAEARAEAREDR